MHDAKWSEENTEPKPVKSLSFRLTIIMVDLRDKARYQRGHSAHYRNFKLATSTFVLSIIDVDFYSHIPQVLHFYYKTLKLGAFWQLSVIWLAGSLYVRRFPPQQSVRIEVLNRVHLKVFTKKWIRENIRNSKIK